MVEQVARDLGPIDILVNNAGIAIVRGVDELSESDFDQTILVNLKSVFLCTQAVLPAMRARQWGRIVNISSGAARGAGAIGPHYNASKAGMEGLTRGYAARLVKEGITGRPSSLMAAWHSFDAGLRAPLCETCTGVCVALDSPGPSGQKAVSLFPRGY
jgi:hypothetical protein